MADNTPRLGELAPEDARRDAIHIAVAPIVAGCTLQPGEPVWLNEKQLAYHAGDLSPVGIVDPFLTAPVQSGERFWLCLYPGTITGLRHVWTHPAFQPVSPVVQQQGYEGESFLQALQKDPYDQQTRLVYADWLEENGFEDLAVRERQWTIERQRAEDWMHRFAEAVGISYHDVIQAGHDALTSGTYYVQYGSQDARDFIYEGNNKELYWHHWEVLTNVTVTESQRSHGVFSCSC